ncbi:NLR family CARD domain-containing protein 4-like [Branchiostoma floridae]|uniref:NLR family CARD domain-containing protein 4-like n=1 Tax=Branchiostoma floridae TaxID=7739 RepID=A0A9J7LKT4_BRAFL|nr:NLR family CARD domain-containing protein 4-like [Branchiostoma floridae]
MAEGQDSSHTGVRRYFFFTKENVSSDWKDLAFHLGFGRADTDNIACRNRDDKSRCMDLLEEWVKRHGDRATVEVLMESLAGANLQSTVDGLTTKYPGKMFTIPIHERFLSISDAFLGSIRKYYELKLTKLKPLIWNDNFTLSLSDVFTELQLIQTRAKRSGPAAEIKRLDDLFNSNVTEQSKTQRCILIEAEPGGGKTTVMSREALDAVSRETELGRRHDIVLLIRLREVREGETIEEMVWDQCVPETTEGIDIQSIKPILQQNESRVLFLLDGYDELQPEARAAGQAIPKLLSGKLYPNSTIVITSRPSSEGVQKHAQPDCHARIIGFSSELVTKYVEKYFAAVGKQDLAKTLTGHLEENDVLGNLVKTPFFLMLVCLLWEEDQMMVSTGTMTGLYGNLLTCLVKKHCTREGVDMPTDGMPSDLATALLQLGKIALEALLKNESQLELAEVEKQNVNVKLLLKLGVVFSEVSASKLHPRKQLTFAHKTMQEFLAGRYLATVVVNQNIGDLLKLQSINEVFEHSTLIQFTCGCDSRAAQAVMYGLVNFLPTMLAELREKATKYDQPEKEIFDTYERFTLLCFRILNERTDPKVLQVVNRVLPVIKLQNYKMDRKQHAALKYFLQNHQPSDTPYKMTLEVNGVSSDVIVLYYLEQTFTSPTPCLQLDLKLSEAYFDSPDETSRLVSVLKNVPRLRALHIEDENLTPEKLKPLVQGLKHVSLLEELRFISNTDLGDAGIEVLLVGLDYVPHLAVLHIEDCNVTDVSMASLASYMDKLSRLKELHLNASEFGDTGLVSLATVFPRLIAIQVLALRRNRFTNAGMPTLAPALCHLPGLLKLDISGNMIGDTGVECLSDILPYLAAMEVLKLSGTGIGDKGISALVKPLAQLVELQVLDVSHNSIGERAIVSLVQTFCQPSALDMEQNPPRDKSGTTPPHCNTAPQERDSEKAKGTGQMLQTPPSKLSELNMSHVYQRTPVHLPDTAAMAVAEALPRLPALKCLGLGEISMETEGFQALVQAAEEHPMLRELT